MQINDQVVVTCHDSCPRRGVLRAIATRNDGVMYLVALDDFPLGIWFFNDGDRSDNVRVEPV